MYQTPTYEQIKQSILTERENLTGSAVTSDSDAAIRAAGTASALEGLYDYQVWAQRQLFAESADEEFLLIHSNRLGITRHTGSAATGTVLIVGAEDAVVAIGSQLTDAQGGQWLVIASVTLDEQETAIASVVATTIGEAGNRDRGTNLNLIAAPSGVQPFASVITLSGGESPETVGAWRQRVIATRQAGVRQDRADDYERIAHGVAGVGAAYTFPRRRGAGTVDLCIVAKSADSLDLPSELLLSAVQAALDAEKPVQTDVRAYAPEVVPVNVVATITGTASIAFVRAVIREYLLNLLPAEQLLVSEIIARVKAVVGVVDIHLSIDNIIPVNDWMRTEWLRPSTITVVAA